MSKLREIGSRIRGLFGKDRLDNELAEELSAHLEMLVEENLRRGMSPREAQYAARRSFGGIEQTKEAYRDQRGLPIIETFIQDIRYGFRALGRNPGFAAVAVFSLALGITINITIFSFINALLLRPPAVESPDQLVEVWNHNPKAASAFEAHMPMSYPEYAWYRDNNRAFSDLIAYDGDPAFVSWSQSDQGRLVQGQYVSGNFFSGLRVGATLGRTFLAEEDRPEEAQPVVVISYAFWRRQLGADPGIAGTALTLNGLSFTVIGVAPAGFTGMLIGAAPDFWAPLASVPLITHDSERLTRLDSHWLLGIGRLSPAVERGGASADMNLLASQFAQAHPERVEAADIAVFPATMLPGPFRGFVGAFTAVLQIVTGMVLLIACANAAGFLLAQACARRREFAVRSALGATRKRLIRQIITESLLLSCLSGVLGYFLAIWTSSLLLKLKPASLPVSLDVAPDWRVVAFTVLLSLLAGLFFGIAPALRGTKTDVVSTLKSETVGGGFEKSRLRSVMVVAQVAVCLLLLIGGGLCLRSLFKAQAIDYGFEINDRVFATLDVESLGYSQARGQTFYRRLLENVAALPDVKSASLASYLPLETTSMGMLVNLEGNEPEASASGIGINAMDVGPEFFKAMGTPLLRGREFDQHDIEGAPFAVVINETLANRYWPGQDPVGHRLTTADAKDQRSYQIVGVVKTGKYRSLGEEPRPFLYRSILQHYHSKATLVAFANGAAGELLAAIRKTEQSLDPNLVLINAGTMRDQLGLALFPARATATLLGIFGLIAMSMAITGLAGVISYSISQRKREIGIRMALGAQRKDILKLVVGQALKLSLSGICLGIALAVALTRFLESLLLDVGSTDPLTFAVVTLLLICVAVVACWIPASRATKVDPMIALRHE